MGLIYCSFAARFFSDDIVVCTLMISAKKYSIPYWRTLKRSLAMM